MKLNLKWMIGAIILTNILTFMIVKVYFPTTIHHNSYFLKMKGQGEHWKISDYQFVWITNHGAVSGSANITYVADPNQLTGGIMVEIYDYFKGGTIPHATYTVPVDRLDDNASFVTGGGGAYPPNDLGVQDIVKKTYFIIHWETKDGVKHQEKINVELDFDRRILDHFVGVEF
ncbi:hypothetical protein CULT_40102 [[Clostridium] ultunense Esp]|nr:hypothetical protein CULT_40102 [[Clostridium] ultunense Esp]